MYRGFKIEHILCNHYRTWIDLNQPVINQPTFEGRKTAERYVDLLHQYFVNPKDVS